jgi:hypothetical protein
MARERQLSMIDRMLEQAIGKHLDVGSECEPMRSTHPLLWQWLATVYVGEDYIKTPPAITITLVPGGVSARVRHPGASACFAYDAGQDSWQARTEIAEKAKVRSCTFEHLKYHDFMGGRAGVVLPLSFLLLASGR